MEASKTISQRDSTTTTLLPPNIFETISTAASLLSLTPYALAILDTLQTPRTLGASPTAAHIRLYAIKTTLKCHHRRIASLIEQPSEVDAENILAATLLLLQAVFVLLGPSAPDGSGWTWVLAGDLTEVEVKRLRRELRCVVGIVQGGRDERWSFTGLAQYIYAGVDLAEKLVEKIPVLLPGMAGSEGVRQAVYPALVDREIDLHEEEEEKEKILNREEFTEIERLAFLNWISAIDMEQEHQQIWESMMGGDGDEGESMVDRIQSSNLFQWNVYQEWLNGNSAHLWLTENTRSGKTQSCAQVVDSFLSISPTDPTRHILFFYISNATDNSALGIFCSLVHQFMARANIPTPGTKRLWTAFNSGQLLPQTATLQLVYTELLEVSSKVHIVVDGLDQCSMQEVRTLIALLKPLGSGKLLPSVFFSSKDVFDMDQLGVNARRYMRFSFPRRTLRGRDFINTPDFTDVTDRQVLNRLAEISAGVYPIALMLKDAIANIKTPEAALDSLEYFHSVLSSIQFIPQSPREPEPLPPFIANYHPITSPQALSLYQQLFSVCENDEQFYRCLPFLAAYALSIESIEMLKALFDSRQHAELTTYRIINGETLLHRAIALCSRKLVKFLRDSGADINAEDDQGYPCWLRAAASESPEQFHQLLSQRRDTLYNRPYVPGSDTSGLYEAAANGDVKNVLRVLKNGGNPSVTTPYGWAPLHWAADKGYLACVILLLDADARRNQVSDKYLTPLDLAVRGGEDRIVRLLREKGAKLFAEIQAEKGSLVWNKY